MRKVIADLRAVSQRFTSLETMAESLRSYPGFENLNRATISRWLKKPSKRAALAITILNSRGSPATLRIAEPKTLWVVTSNMLTCTPKEDRPYGLLKTQYRVEGKSIEVQTGGEALELLNQGQVEIALAASDLFTG